MELKTCVVAVAKADHERLRAIWHERDDLAMDYDELEARAKRLESLLRSARNFIDDDGAYGTAILHRIDAEVGE